VKVFLVISSTEVDYNCDFEEVEGIFTREELAKEAMEELELAVPTSRVDCVEFFIEERILDESIEERDERVKEEREERLKEEKEARVRHQHSRVESHEELLNLNELLKRLRFTNE